MDDSGDRDYSQQLGEFRRDYLNRILIAMGAVVWLVGSAVLLIQSTALALGIIFTFEILCFASYLLGRWSNLPWAERLFTLGTSLWISGLVLITREPLLLLFLILFVPVVGSLLSFAETVGLTILVVAIELVISLIYLKNAWSGLGPAILPFATIVAAIFSCLREINFQTVLIWADGSTRNAQERLKEVREHRAKLYLNVKSLDEAYGRLERMNEMLIDARAEAERARQARDQFALTVSHELRTPLSFIIGFSEVMVNSPELYGNQTTWPAGLYEDIQDIYRSSCHLLNLVNDVLDLGKVDANKLLLIKEPTTPNAIVQEAVTIMRNAFVSKGLSLTVEVDSSLPDLFIDRTRIRQVLINLMNNALRFTEQGGISILADRNAEGIVFCVQDTGPGIPESEIPKVFEKFGQANSTIWRRRDGTGLGVPISQRFVEMHGGRMWLESTMGEGTRFYFTLPLPETVTWPGWLARPESEDYWKLKMAQNQSGRLILVLSNDPGAGYVLEENLKGYQLVVTNIKDVREQIERLLPQGLIIDQGFSNMQGLESLLQVLPYDLPVLALPLPGSMAKMHELPEGVVDYLPKPVLRDHLTAALDRLQKPIHRLMVIDDEETMTRFVSLALHRANSLHQVDIWSAASAKEALDQLDPTKIGNQQDDLPDVILLDLGLPDMDGWELLGNLKTIFSQQGKNLPPVILVTAVTLQEELDSRQRKTLEISTIRTLSAEELGHVVQSSLDAIHPRFTPARTAPTRPESLAAKTAF